MKQTKKLSAQKYRELFKLRAEGKLEPMECTKNLFKILDKLHLKKTTILDIPCGVGHYLHLLKDLGDIQYLGIDLDSKSIKMAKNIWKNFPKAKFQQGNVFNLNFKDNSFDVVVCYNLLMHLKDYSEALKKLFRVSKKYLIIRSLFDDKKSLHTFKANKDNLEVYPKGIFYYNTYSKDEVQEFLKKLGPCKYRFINDNLPIPESSLRNQAKKLGVNNSEFAKGKTRKKQDWKGLKLNYEVLFIKKCVTPDKRPI